MEKAFYSINKSKEAPGKYRVVQWIGKQPNVLIKTIADGLGYGEAVLKKKELLGEN